MNLVYVFGLIPFILHTGLTRLGNFIWEESLWFVAVLQGERKLPWNHMA